MRIKEQARQTIISTGVVGALFGLLMASANIAFDSEYGQNVAGARIQISLAVYGWHAAVAFVGTTLGCVLLFGIVPMAIQHALVWFAHRKTDRI